MPFNSSRRDALALLSVRARNCIAQYAEDNGLQINSLEDIAKLPIQELYSMKNMGYTAITHLIFVLRDHGLEMDGSDKIFKWHSHDFVVPKEFKRRYQAVKISWGKTIRSFDELVFDAPDTYNGYADWFINSRYDDQFYLDHTTSNDLLIVKCHIRLRIKTEIVMVFYNKHEEFAVFESVCQLLLSHDVTHDRWVLFTTAAAMLDNLPDINA